MSIIKSFAQWFIWLIEPEKLVADTAQSPAKSGIRSIFKKTSGNKSGNGASLPEDTGIISFLFKPDKLETETGASKDTDRRRDDESFLSYLIKPEKLTLSDPIDGQKAGFFSWLLSSEDLQDDKNRKV